MRGTTGPGAPEDVEIAGDAADVTIPAASEPRQPAQNLGVDRQGLEVWLRFQPGPEGFIAGVPRSGKSAPVDAVLASRKHLL